MHHSALHMHIKSTQVFVGLTGWCRRWKGKTPAVSSDRVFVPTRKTGPTSSVDGITLAMLSRGCPVPPEGRGWGSAKSSCVNGFAGGPAVAWCSGSAVIVTEATGIAASAAGGKRGGNNVGPPTGGSGGIRPAGRCPGRVGNGWNRLWRPGLDRGDPRPAIRDREPGRRYSAHLCQTRRQGDPGRLRAASGPGFRACPHNPGVGRSDPCLCQQGQLLA